MTIDDHNDVMPIEQLGHLKDLNKKMQITGSKYFLTSIITFHNNQM